ncbi:MAG: dolichyl-phosphate beta-glucosyltransferase [Planctomycetota bacterium]
MQLSIVIPAYNEAGVITAHLERIIAYCRDRSLDAEIIVADDGSTDATAACVEAYRQRAPEVRLLPLKPNRGKGHAVRQGLAAARGDIRGFTDADGATPIEELDRVLPALEAGADLAIGSRAKRDDHTTVTAHLHRRIIGRTFNSILRLLVGLRDRDGRTLLDTQCGFKWFRQAACEAVLEHATVDGFAFDVELLFLARRLGFGIVEIPVNWTEQGNSSVHLVSDSLKMFRTAATLRRRHRDVHPP